VQVPSVLLLPTLQAVDLRRAAPQQSGTAQRRRAAPARAERGARAQVYAFAVLGYHPGARLLSAVAKGVQWQLRDFSPQARRLRTYPNPIPTPCHAACEPGRSGRRVSGCGLGRGPPCCAVRGRVRASARTKMQETRGGDVYVKVGWRRAARAGPQQHRVGVREDGRGGQPGGGRAAGRAGGRGGEPAARRARAPVLHPAERVQHGVRARGPPQRAPPRARPRAPARAGRGHHSDG